MAGRKADPNTRYRVYTHKDRQYTYAAVQEPRDETQGGKGKYTTVHLGKVDENLRFIPNAKFRLIDPEEQKNYIFPENWDISSILIKNPCADIQENSCESSRKMDTHDMSDANNSAKKDIKQSSENSQDISVSDDVLNTNQFVSEYNTRLYGSFWLIEEISKNIGLYDDLLSVFNNNVFIVNEILSLSIYPFVSGKNFNRFYKWQNTHRTLIDYHLSSTAINKLSQKITDFHRMSLIKRRLERQPKNSYIGCDSTTRSAWGKCLADIHWGRNKDNEKLQNTLEVVVYSLTTHQPIYYRSFPGNTSDISTVRTILSDLRAVGIDIHNVIFIIDRGYISEENIASFVSAGLSFIMCSKVNLKIISSLLSEIQYDADGSPVNMQFDTEKRLFFTQVDIPDFTSKLPDGTDAEIKGLKANLFMSLPKRMDEITSLKLKISEERSILEKAQNERNIPADIKKYNALFDYFKVVEVRDESGNIVNFSFSECVEKIKKEKARCGFFSSLMYNVQKTSIEALNQYKERDEQEKCFDLLKNQMSFYVQRNSTESGKNGRSFIAFTGLIAISVLRHVWQTSMRDKYSSTLDMLDEMESIRFSEYPNGTGHMTTFTMRQVEICRACGIEPPYECLPSSLKKQLDRNANPKKCARKTEKSENTSSENH